MNVMYPVVFYRDVDGDKFSMFVPDFDYAMATGVGLDDALFAASDLIAFLSIYKLECHENLPVPSRIEHITFDEIEKDFDDNVEYECKFKKDVIVNLEKFERYYRGIGKLPEERIVDIMIQNGIV